MGEARRADLLAWDWPYSLTRRREGLGRQLLKMDIRSPLRCNRPGRRRIDSDCASRVCVCVCVPVHSTPSRVRVCFCPASSTETTTTVGAGWHFWKKKGSCNLIGKSTPRVGAVLLCSSYPERGFAVSTRFPAAALSLSQAPAIHSVTMSAGRPRCIVPGRMMSLRGDGDGQARFWCSGGRGLGDRCGGGTTSCEFCCSCWNRLLLFRLLSAPAAGGAKPAFFFTSSWSSSSV